MLMKNLHLRKSMFASNSTEANEEEVAFPEDSVKALNIVLRLAHLRYVQVPKILKFSTLIELAILCDKYDLVSLVRPYLHDWCAPHSEQLCAVGYEEWLYLAWVFGYATGFKKLANMLAMQIRTNAEGHCLTTGGRGLDKLQMPPGIVDHLLSIRASIVERLHGVCCCYVNPILAESYVKPHPGDVK
ncbi:hypothetical protein EJ08DRAFT_477381 [Tothia fuscella]|uniref:Uncharacterized protein n=1 Tax=Tothia fuscella TaxID=1048955 RepID=A0A9P4TU41_9PEZI|nr:hypothetical protein EJ08DRAFT_477381 [Tothia fuscella]